MTASDNRAAVLWVLLSTAIFSLIFASAKFADGAVSTSQILLLRYLSGFATVAVVAHLRGGLRQHRSFRPVQHGLRAFFGVSAGWAITWASARMPIADATALGMLYGVLAVLLGIVVLGERVMRAHWVAILLSLAGAGVLLWGQGAFRGALPLVPASVAFLSAVLLALEGLYIQRLSRAEPALTLLLNVAPYGIALMILPAIWTWQPLDLWTLLWCLALGPVATFAQYCTIRGFRIAPLSVVGPVDYSWLIFAVLLGVFVFGERPGWGVLVGGALIVLGGVMLARIKAR
ncbi:MAG: DMT family transporter [Paracoccaceae bacterium]